jgi:hypothetical protein
MTNEEILKAVQNEKNDEFEQKEANRSLMLGAAVAIAVCVIMIIVEWVVLKKVDYGKPTIIFVFSGAADLYEGIKNKKRKSKIIGIVELILAVIGLGLYIGAIIA